ncbi:MAG: gluconate 2-dehydrogenase subunit 3 family protein [Candidatus Pedobacter colombiensis]|uniref:Gluconate 2-dehydrogenase subunit 3 family protein n=1 Tax=Candidatus Pedobacter colombiensis TaxID=3121371 RepID=A0AAJ5W5I8_9SPHI|nr:gluconate 2-dehydrogenase subunit 3 family protein [Pedobacter sp.]WEK17503.1 MAG: gluconate 2-dehydrogenase subunit 3 family protein [Pedobacter sp.]
MNRREALKNTAVLLGTAISATTFGVLFESFTLPENEKNSISFSADQEKVLAEFADIIIPPTKDAGGAKAAGLGSFIPMMITDCYPAKMQEAFAEGLKEMEAKSLKDFNKDFLSLTVKEREKLVGDLRTETIEKLKADKAAKRTGVTYFFVLARDLTILGYYASEIGCTQSREYIAIPGRYDGAADLKPGQKSWAS